MAVQLRQKIGNDLVKVVDYVLEKILEENERTIREAFLTNRGNPSVYQRTNEFYQAWDYKTKANAMSRKQAVQGEFYYSPTAEYATHGHYMKTSEPPNASNDFMGQHHGIGGIWGDSREYLADILYKGISYNIYLGKKVKGINAFDKLVKRIGKRKFANWVNEGMDKYHIKYIRHSYPSVSNEK